MGIVANVAGSDVFLARLIVALAAHDTSNDFLSGHAGDGGELDLNKSSSPRE